jgi:hypothetical protein
VDGVCEPRREPRREPIGLTKSLFHRDDPWKVHLTACQAASLSVLRTDLPSTQGLNHRINMPRRTVVDVVVVLRNKPHPTIFPQGQILRPSAPTSDLAKQCNVNVTLLQQCLALNRSETGLGSLCLPCQRMPGDRELFKGRHVPDCHSVVKFFSHLFRRVLGIRRLLRS